MGNEGKDSCFYIWKTEYFIRWDEVQNEVNGRMVEHGKFNFEHVAFKDSVRGVSKINPSVYGIYILK